MLDHVCKQRRLHEICSFFHLLLILQSLDKYNIRTSFFVSDSPVDRILIAVDGNCVRAGNDHRIGILPGIDGGAYFCHHLLFGDDLLALHMAAALGHDLILKLYTGYAGLFKQFYRAYYIKVIAISSVAVCNDGKVCRFTYVSGLFSHLCLRKESHIRQAQSRIGNACACHIKRFKAYCFGCDGGESIIDAGEHQDSLVLKDFLQFPSHFLSPHIMNLRFG